MATSPESRTALIGWYLGIALTGLGVGVVVSRHGLRWGTLLFAVALGAATLLSRRVPPR